MGRAMTSTIEWEPIQGFQSRLEYERFVRWIEGLIADGRVAEVPVGRRYADATTVAERSVQRADGGEPWRIVEPDAPFRGVFEPAA